MAAKDHDSELSQLITATNHAQSCSLEGKTEALLHAFTLFSKETKQLQNAYKALRSEFEKTNLALEQSNTTLQQKIVELDMITYYLDMILSNIAQGLLFIDLRGIVTTYNPAAESLLRIDADQVLFQPFWKHFADDFFGFSLKEALQTLRFPAISALSLDQTSGKSLDLEIHVSSVRKQDISPNTPAQALSEVDISGLIILIRDVSEVRQLQLLATRQNRMQELGEMAAMVAHEIRNPLGGIKGFAALLERDLADNPPLKEMATYIVHGTDTINQLVTRVLQYARPVRLQLHPTDLVGLIKDLEKHVQADPALQHHCEIVTVFSEESLIVSIDPLLIKSALLNLLVNAAQATPANGKITITAMRNQEQAVIAVTDTGQGIPKENLEKIFSPFFTTKAEGSGFGLAEVHKNVQAHGGSIAVASQPGMGATFTIFLPIYPMQLEEGHENVMIFDY